MPNYIANIPHCVSNTNMIIFIDIAKVLRIMVFVPILVSCRMPAADRLSTAAKTGDLPELRRLIASGYNVNWIAMHNKTPLMNAIQARQIDSIKLLLASGANVNAKDNPYASPLMCAVGTGRIDIVTLILKAGADRTFINSEGNTAYDWAVSNGNIEIASLVKPSPIPSHARGGGF